MSVRVHQKDVTLFKYMDLCDIKVLERVSCIMHFIIWGKKRFSQASKFSQLEQRTDVFGRLRRTTIHSGWKPILFLTLTHQPNFQKQKGDLLGQGISISPPSFDLINFTHSFNQYAGFAPNLLYHKIKLHIPALLYYLIIHFLVSYFFVKIVSENK